MDSKNLIKTVIQKAPVYGLIRYAIKGVHEDRRKGITENRILAKILAHGVFALAFISYSGLIYPTAVRQTGEFNPIKQSMVYDRKDKLRTQLFEPNGLADKNKDGIISLIEKAEAHTRMGYFNSRQIFFDPSVERLKRAVKSYGTENQ